MQDLAGYALQIDLSPGSSGVTFTGATAHPTNGIFGSKTPVVNVLNSGNRLQVADNLSGPFQSADITDGSVLFRAFFDVAAGTSGTFNIDPSLSEFVDANGETIHGVTINSGSVNVMAAPSTLFVTSFQETASGFVAEFSQALDVNDLNLYHTLPLTGVGPADVVVQGATVGEVRGSLIVSADARSIEFVKTGGILAADQYTVTLRSAGDGFNTGAGGLLDGNVDGAAGDAFMTSFVVAAPTAETVILSLPDFTRGYGQNVTYPNASAAGIPLTLSRGQSITGLDVHIHFDPALLNITDFVSAIGAAASTFNVIAPGEAILTMSSATQLSSTTTPLVLGHFVAAVPDTAFYTAKQAIRFSELAIFDDSESPLEIQSIGDRAVHIAAYFGDTNASRTYNSPDATLEQRLIAQINNGLPAYLLADPLLIGDINHNGNLQSNDTSNIQRAAAQIPVTNIPPLPGLPNPGSPGIDPKLFIPTNLAADPGTTLTVPIMLEVTEPGGIDISGMDLVFNYDTTKFDVSNADVRLGSLLSGSGFAFTPNVDDANGRIIIIASSGTGTSLLPFGTIGTLFEIDFDVDINATGSSVVNIMANDGGVEVAKFHNDLANLILNPAPTNDPTDEVDGLITIISPNTPPIANAGGPYNVDEGGSVLLSAAGSTDAEQDPATLTYEWDLDNDGQFDDATGITTTFDAAGIDGIAGGTVRTISLRVTDSDNSSHETTTTVTINNVAPTGMAGDHFANEGSLALITGSASDPSAADEANLTYEWDFDGDGQFDDATGQNPLFDASLIDGSLGGTVINIALRVSDDDGGSHGAVTVFNRNPTVQPGCPY